MDALFIVLIVGVVAVLMYLSHLAEKKRRTAFMQLAARLGLRYNPHKDRSYDNSYRFLSPLQQGSNRHALNILKGNHQSYDIEAFDYHYETHSTDSDGNTQTHHHYFSYYLLFLPRHFEQLKITKEGLFSKIGQAFGFDDIDFESHEFSRKFCVRSKDKKLAYDVCNAQMIEYLLDNRDLNIEVDHHVLAFYFSSRLKLEEIESNLNRLVKVRSLMPDYLFS